MLTYLNCTLANLDSILEHKTNYMLEILHNELTLLQYVRTNTGPSVYSVCLHTHTHRNEEERKNKRNRQRLREIYACFLQLPFTLLSFAVYIINYFTYSNLQGKLLPLVSIPVPRQYIPWDYTFLSSTKAQEEKRRQVLSNGHYCTPVGLYKLHIQLYGHRDEHLMH